MGTVRGYEYGEETEIPDDVEDINWDDLRGTYTFQTIHSIPDKFGYKNLSYEQRTAIYLAKNPDRSLPDLPEDQDYVIRFGDQKFERCKATVKYSGRRCAQAATHHGLCYWHGGGPKDNPGGYNKYKKTILKHVKNNEAFKKKVMEYAETLDDRKNMEEQIAIAKVIRDELVDMDDFEMESVMAVVSEITKMIDRKSNVEQRTALTQSDLQQLVSVFTSSVEGVAKNLYKNGSMMTRLNNAAQSDDEIKQWLENDRDFVMKVLNAFDRNKAEEMARRNVTENMRKFLGKRED